MDSKPQPLRILVPLPAGYYRGHVQKTFHLAVLRHGRVHLRDVRDDQERSADLGHVAGPSALIMVALLFTIGAIYSARKIGVMYSSTTSTAGLFGLFRTKRSATRVVTRIENPFEYWFWLGGSIVFCTALIALSALAADEAYERKSPGRRSFTGLV